MSFEDKRISTVKLLYKTVVLNLYNFACISIVNPIQTNN